MFVIQHRFAVITFPVKPERLDSHFVANTVFTSVSGEYAILSLPTEKDVSGAFGRFESRPIETLITNGLAFCVDESSCFQRLDAIIRPTAVVLV